MPQGFLPIWYLGLPLCTKKLTILNCESLLQSVRAKITSWLAKYLSFVGRKILLTTIIAGITNFWCNDFVLPNRCIEKINLMCSAYLWKGSLEGRHVAKVAWETVTTPTDEGGLGIKNLLIWNKNCAIKLLWFLIFKNNSVWVACIHQNIIKDNSIWDLKKKQSHTWIIKQILKIRGYSYQWVRLVPGNRQNCKFWSDPWYPYAPLTAYIGANGSCQTGITLSATLESLWHNGMWHLPSARSQRFENILIHLSSVNLTNSEDTL